MQMTPDTLVKLSTALYDACYDPFRWPQAAQALRHCLDSMAATLVLRQGTGFETVHTDCDADYSRKYWQELAAQDPMLAGPGEAHRLYCNQMVMETSHFRRSALFSDWLQPQGRHSVLLIKVPDGRQTAAIFSLNRGGTQTEYDALDIAAVKQITPLLYGAIQHARRIAQLRTGFGTDGCADTGLGHIIVSPRRRILQMNAMAEALLCRYSGTLGCRNGRLNAGNAHAESQIVAGIARACQGDRAGAQAGTDLLLRDPDDRPVLTLAIAPMPHGQAFGLGVEHVASVTLRRLQADIDGNVLQRVQTLFGLSRKEAELACTLIEGCSLQEAAERRAVGITTVRSQLSSLFRKTGTSRQGQLIALLARSAPL